MKKLAHVAKPCADCPFRREGGIRLYRDRILEIASVVAPEDFRGGTLPCHKTVDHDERDQSTEKECAGALIFMYKVGASTQMSRIGERLGMIDPGLAEGEHPEIFDDLDEWLDSALQGRRNRRRPQR